MSAFEVRSIRVDQFSEPNALLLAWQERAFDAILVQDQRASSRHWLKALQAQVASRAPIIAVGVGDAYSIAQALMSGADDYATEAEGPFGLVQRVLARVRAKPAVEQLRPLRVGAYALHMTQRVVASPGQQVRLTVRESDLAQVLFEHHGRLATADMLSAVLHGHANAASKRSIEQHVYKLRKKFELVSTQQATLLRIDSIYASGYRLVG